MTTSPNNALEPLVGASSSTFAIDIIGPAWLSLGLGIMLEILDL